jgi:hypothetical protein
MKKIILSLSALLLVIGGYCYYVYQKAYNEVEEEFNNSIEGKIMVISNEQLSLLQDILEAKRIRDYSLSLSLETKDSVYYKQYKFMESKVDSIEKKSDSLQIIYDSLNTEYNNEQIKKYSNP